MSDPDFSMDPDDLTSSSPETDDEDSVGQLEFQNTGNYDPKEPFRVFVRGHAESYDEWFLVVLELDPTPESPELSNLEVLSAQKPDHFTNLGLDNTGDFGQWILSLRNSLNQTELKDSTNLENKLDGLLSQSSTLGDLLSPLTEEDVESFRDEFIDFLIGEVFPGSQLDLYIYVEPMELEEEGSTDSSPESKDAGEQKDDDSGESNDQEDSPKLLAISPEVRPTGGIPLADLQEGDAFDVRVVGDSARDLRSRFIDGNPEEAEESKIFNARLVRIQDVGIEDVKKYIVQLTEDIYGEFSMDPSTRVKIRSMNDLSFLVRLKYWVFYFLVLVLILLFSLSVMFMLFPEPIVLFINTGSLST